MRLRCECLSWELTVKAMGSKYIAALENVRRLCMGLLIGLFALPLAAQNVAVVISEETPIYVEIADNMRRTIDASGMKALKLMTIPVHRLIAGEKEIFRTDFYQLVVTLGAHAANVIAKTDVKAPVLNSLIPRALYDQLYGRGMADGRSSAIFLDQPFSRQLDLARLIFPGRSRFCVVYGPHSRAYGLEFERAALVKGYSVVAEGVERASDLGPVLLRALPRCEFLFALPDADIVNRNTIQQILLTSYHSNDPVLAFSAAHVKAGALAAVFSTPEQVARQTAEVILKFCSEGKFILPPPHYPRYWGISVNRQVARSFGMVISEDSELQSKLSQSAEEE
jgi:putative tryptophan/tyrosine transport system substrate-binding protein